MNTDFSSPPNEDNQPKIHARDIVRALQRKAGLPVTGVLDEATVDLVNEEDDPVDVARDHLIEVFEEHVKKESIKFVNSEGLPYFILQPNQLERLAEHLNAELIEARNPHAL